MILQLHVILLFQLQFIGALFLTFSSELDYW